MDIKEALGLCMSGWRVRPVCWGKANSNYWIEYFESTGGRDCSFFAERGSKEEMPHALRLSTPDEFLGDWEVVS